MCRLMAYFGPNICVAEVVLLPSRSIIKQSYDARERRNDSSLPFHTGYGNLNGDGFGIGWFPPAVGGAVEPSHAHAEAPTHAPAGAAAAGNGHAGAPAAYVSGALGDRSTPCVFTSITPAWNNENLNRLANKLESGLIFAHVRAAYPGMPVSEQNCHPFQWGRYLFMHNGVVAGFMKVRRSLLGLLSDAAYNTVQSFHSDSAVSFSLFLHHLPDLHAPQPPEVLLRAMEATVAVIAELQAAEGISDTSLLNFVVSDGNTLIATRYVSNAAEAPASLYYAEGSGYERGQSNAVSRKFSAAAAALHAQETMQGGSGAAARTVTDEADYHLTYSELGSRVCLIASEPVTSSASDWVEVPPNTALVVCREKAGVLSVLLSPLCPSGAHPRQAEVSRCLEAVTRASGLTAEAHLANRVGSSSALLALRSGSGAGLPHPSGSKGAAAGGGDVVHGTPRHAAAAGQGGNASGVADNGDSGGELTLRREGSGSLRHAPGGSGAVLDALPRVVRLEEHRLTGHCGAVMCCVAEGGLLFTGSTDCTIRVWSLAACSCVGTLRGHRDPIRRLALAGGLLYSAGAKTVRVWGLGHGFPCLAVLQVADIRGSVKAMCVGPGGVLYTGGQSCRVEAFFLGELPPQWASSGMGGIEGAAGAAAAAAAACSPSKPPAGGPAGGGPRKHAAATPAAAPMAGSPRWAAVSAAAAGGLVAAGISPGDGPAAAWAAVAGNGSVGGRAGASPSPPPTMAGLLLRCTTRANSQGLGDCPMLGDSPRNPLASQSVRSCVGTAAAASVTSDIENSHCGAITALALSGDYLFSASTDSTLRVWRARTLQFVRVLRGHRGSVLALHAAPGVVLSGGRDQLIRVWDVDTLVCRRTLAGHTDDILALDGLCVPLGGEELSSELPDITSPVNPLGYSPPGELQLPVAPGSPRRREGSLVFASASADGTVRLWSAQCYSCLRVFGAARAAGSVPWPPVMSCALSEAYTAASMPDGTVRLFTSDDVYARAVEDLFDGGDCEGEEPNPPTAGFSGLVAFDPRPPACGCEHPPPSKRRRGIGGAASLGPLGTGGAAGTAAPPSSRLERELERALRQFTAIRSVCADPGAREECFRGAKFLLRLLEGMGAEVKLSQPVEDKNPVVIARLGHDPSKPTVTFYGHYDVQPALEPQWETDPFELTSVDGWLYGRGTTDNKGPILAFVYAVKELLEECKAPGGGCMPLNVAFIFEGEEENGSTGFKEAVGANLRWFEGSSAVVISNTLWVGERTPCLTYGMRGMISLSIEVRGPARDLHSGNEGGVFTEPLAELSKVLGSLVDSRAAIMVPGFYSGVRQDMLAEVLARLARSPGEFSLEGYKAALGVPALSAGRSESELLTARWCQPSLSVVDVRVGAADESADHYRFGPTRFSVIPKAAVGQVSVRYVPAQDASQLVELLTAHVHHEFGKLRSANTISVKVHSVGDWWEASPDSALMRIAERAVAQEWGAAPLLVREGGTMPVASALEKLLGAPALLLPMGQSSDNPHLPNERIRRVNLMHGKNVVKRLLLEIAAQPQQQQPGGAAAAATYGTGGGGASNGIAAANGAPQPH